MMQPVTKCRSCGKSVSWGVTPRGKNIPLDVPQVSDVHKLRELTDEWTHARGLYCFIGTENKVRPVTVAEVMHGGPNAIYLTHYATCPDAHQWRKPKDEV